MCLIIIRIALYSIIMINMSILVMITLVAIISHRSSMLLLVLSIEMASAILYFHLIITGSVINDSNAFLFGLIVLAIGACEVAIGMSLVLLISYRRYNATMVGQVLLV